MNRQESIAKLRESFRTVPPGMAVVVDDFRPEDAPGVANLYYAIYGDDFPLDYVYDPEAITAANATDGQHQVVARTTTGEVVGAASLFRSAPGAHIMECGGLMLLPEYRKGRTGLELPRRTHKNLPARLGLWATYGQSVCDHLTTQKIGERLNYCSYALELEALPTQTDRSRGAPPRRTSLLDQFEVIRDRPQAIYPPERYVEILGLLYAQAGLRRDFAAGCASAGSTRAEIKDIAYADLARLEVLALGQDWPLVLAGFEESRAAATLRQISLPLTDPGLPTALEQARARGYFLAGALPMWRDEDSLLVQKLGWEPAWGEIRLYSDAAHQLLEAIRRDLETL